MARKLKDSQGKKVFSRPPIDGSDEELEAWCEAFISALKDQPVDIVPEEAEPENGSS